MMTVKEISDLTGISARTLHYYDEIGLLKPTDKSAAGYRLYNDDALERLQQILFFREFDIPLKDIKAVINDPYFDKNRILKTQRTMLEVKKQRIERMISSLDAVLKGKNKMDLKIFGKTEREELFEAMLKNMPENLKKTAAEEFGSLENWKTHYIEATGRPEMQEGYKRVIEWYGDKDTALYSMKNPPDKELIKAFQNRTEKLLTDLYSKKELPITSFEVKEIVGEYGFRLKELYGLKDESDFMLMIANTYTSPELRPKYEERYGAGAPEFFADAIISFYRS